MWVDPWAWQGYVVGVLCGLVLVIIIHTPTDEGMRMSLVLEKVEL